MKVYISGPMTGYVEHNFPAFHRAAEHLRSLGYEVVSPAELDDPAATHEELAKIPHWWFLRRDLRVLLDCDLIYLLPGWRWSKGATLEAEVAKGTGIMRLTEHDDALWRTFEGEPLPAEEPPAVLTLPEGVEPAPLISSVTIMPCTVEPVLSRDYLHNYGNSIDEAVDKHHRKA